MTVIRVCAQPGETGNVIIEMVMLPLMIMIISMVMR